MQQLAQGSRCVAAGTIYAAAVDVSQQGFTALYTCPQGRVARIRYISAIDNNGTPHYFTAVQRGSVVHNFRINNNVIANADNVAGLLDGGPTLEAADQLGVNSTQTSPSALLDVVFSIEEYSLGQA